VLVQLTAVIFLCLLKASEVHFEIAKDSFHKMSLLLAILISNSYGWEGSMSDSRLWLKGRTFGAPPIPEGKCLGDAGFANYKTYLTPYRGVRYRLKSGQEEVNVHKNEEELFNLCHSKLRNVVEWTFWDP